MTINPPSRDRVAEALALLQDAHQRLLDSSTYGADVLVYRAILCLSGALEPLPASPASHVKTPSVPALA
ncbi:MAG: hypothetical protein PHE17_07600 [Thiothrix sp.]|jgi:hypothetical protein|uniref:hypothetical protein n=1 Tax=Thiothrix sp. TaxID=1032 RepID=UPI00261C0FE8|nr:hypothetical protein [Thiothrix sp.]MDD5392870.1 hypothetical protein [Thiothrix sp.]